MNGGDLCVRRRANKEIMGEAVGAAAEISRVKEDPRAGPAGRGRGGRKEKDPLSKNATSQAGKSETVAKFLAGKRRNKESP